MWNTELWGKRYKKEGRIGCKDYFKSQLFLFAITLGLFVLALLTLSKAIVCIGAIYACIYLWLTFCLIAKRLHDIGASSWTMLLPILLSFKITIDLGGKSSTYSILGFLLGDIADYFSGAIFIVFLIILLFVKGKSTDNKYGKALR